MHVSRIFLVLLLLSFCAAGHAQTVVDKVKQLDDLRKAGLITAEEFESRKDHILDLHANQTQPDAVESPKWMCNFDEGEIAASITDSILSPEARAGSIVDEILDKLGMPSNFVVRPADVRNAAAMIVGVERQVLYNPSFFKAAKKTDWGAYCVLSHEVAHHLLGHTLGTGSRPALELDADKFSGRMLRKFGCPLRDATAAATALLPDKGSQTHPKRADRIAALTEGWRAEDDGMRPTPTPIPTSGVLTVVTPAPPKLKACEHRTPCVHSSSCQHALPCQHQFPCVHQIPCGDVMPCQHPMICQHPMFGPMGVFAAHPLGDVMHAYDTMHPFHLQHQFDTHQFDLQHPAGDTIHEFDLLHPSGDAA